MSCQIKSCVFIRNKYIVKIINMSKDLYRDIVFAQPYLFEPAYTDDELRKMDA